MEDAISSASTSRCGACTLLGWSCSSDCVFATCFPRNRPNKFAIIQRAFGTEPVWNWLAHVPPERRMHASDLLAYEASYRLRWWATNHPNYKHPSNHDTQFNHDISEKEVLMRLGTAAEAIIVTIPSLSNPFPGKSSCVNADGC